jgi:hypothetical protein
VKPRFQADNDLRNSIRTGVLRREPSIDFQSALAAGLHNLSDPDVLLLATAQGRILISDDENSPAKTPDSRSAGNGSPPATAGRTGTPGKLPPFPSGHRTPSDFSDILPLPNTTCWGLVSQAHTHHPEKRQDGQSANSSNNRRVSGRQERKGIDRDVI